MAILHQHLISKPALKHQHDMSVGIEWRPNG